MEDTFKFELGIGRYPWTSGDITIEVTIPADMHDSVADSIGANKMARLEFGFSFQQIVEKRFPELNAIINNAITDWIDANNIVREDCAPVYYSLQSSWFE